MAAFILLATLTFFSSLDNLVCLVHFFPFEFSLTTALSPALEITFLTGFFSAAFTLAGAFLIS